MCEDFLWNLLRTKIRMLNSVIAVMPPDVKQRATDFQQKLVKTVTEECAERENTPQSKSEKGLKSITID